MGDTAVKGGEAEMKTREALLRVKEDRRIRFGRKGREFLPPGWCFEDRK